MPRDVHTAPPVSRAARRLVLGTAFLLALTTWLAPKSAPVQAQEARPPAAAAPDAPPLPKPPPAPDASKGSGTAISIGPGGIEIKSPASATTDASADQGETTAPEKGKGRTITIEKGGKRVQISGVGADKEYDSVGQFVHDDPAVARMVVAIVTVVFLSPVLAIGLVLWYRMRKAKMLNETMLKLAEKGVVPPADALGALAGIDGATIAASPSMGPLYEQARQMRRRTAWSDLRKGVILVGIGIGLSLFSFFDDREANGLGLVLLFVGIGYVILWWFEQRQAGGPGNSAGGGSSPGG